MSPNINTNKPACPLCSGAMTFGFVAPCDYRKPSGKQPYQVYWCGSCDYGNVWERPSLAEISTFYELERYYTQGSTSQDSNPISWVDRLRIQISWRLDRGETLYPKDVKLYLEGRSLEMCEIGCGNRKSIVLPKTNRSPIEGYQKLVPNTESM
jgi:hypothetical protein